MSDLALAKVFHFFFSQLDIIFETDPCDNLLTESRIGYACDLHRFDRFICHQEFLDLYGVDIFATTNDHVFDTADNVDVTVFIHHGGIPSVHPTALINSSDSCLFIFPVAQHHRVTSGAEFAHFIYWAHFSSLGIDNLYLHVRVNLAHRANTFIQRRIHTGLKANRAGFGHAIGDLYLCHVHQLVDLFHGFGRAGRTGHDARA